MSGRDLDASRARVQAKAEQMLRELLAPDTPPMRPSRSAAEPSPPSGAAAVVIEELAVKLVRRQYWLFGSDPRVHHVLTLAAPEWPGRQRYDDHLTSVMTGIVEDGMATGEFRRRDAATAARVLMECLKSLTHPLLSRQLGRHGAEARARAQVRFLTRALA